MYKFWTFILVVFIISYFMFLIAKSFAPENKIDTSFTYTLMEYAYVKGQADALNNDIRIKMSSTDSTWILIKLPWDDKQERSLSFRPIGFYDSIKINTILK